MAIDLKSRAELNYEWEVKYSDKTEFHQFDDNLDKEYTFADIDQTNLEIFSVTKKDKSKKLSVNLKTGLFYLNDKEFKEIEDNGTIRSIGKQIPNGTVIRVIYFRRVLRMLNSDYQGLINIFHFIGWQGTIDGIYEKHEIGVSNNTDEIVLPPKETFRLL